jgi:SAM-dependent methyltransferase
MHQDYSAITELAGTQLNAEQMERFVHRYATCAKLARGRILEVACGPGIGLAGLQALGHPVTGLCYTPAVLLRAETYFGGRLPLLAGDGQCLPLAAGAFDTVLCLEAIYYFAEPAAFLAEARRVLAPGGMVLLAWANPDWPHFVPGSLARRYPAAPDAAAALQGAGFTGVQLFGAFPLHAADARHALAMRLRRMLLGGPLRRTLAPLAERVKRVVYGPLAALPGELPGSVLREAAATLELAPVPPGQADRVHRVLYAVGGVPPMARGA